jgi:hypothetical protein
VRDVLGIPVQVDVAGAVDEVQFLGLLRLGEGVLAQVEYLDELTDVLRIARPGSECFHRKQVLGRGIVESAPRPTPTPTSMLATIPPSAPWVPVTG